MAKEGGDAAANGGARSEEYEQEKAEDSGRQDEGQGGKGFKRREPAATAQHQQGSKRDGDGKQDDGGHRCELECECERLPVHRVLVDGCEAALGKLGLDGWREKEVEKLVGGRALGCVGDDDCALLDGRIEIARDDEEGAAGCHPGRER